MSKEPTKPKTSLSMTLTGSPDVGQHVTLERKDALQSIFVTKHSDMAEGLLTHCLKVLKSTEARNDHGGYDERTFMVAAVSE